MPRFFMVSRTATWARWCDGLCVTDAVLPELVVSFECATIAWGVYAGECTLGLQCDV